jgi:modulator of FtsH protease
MGALTGLVFVAISINLSRIIDLPGLPARAGATIVVLANALIVSLIALAPDPSNAALGIALLAFGLAGWVIATRLELRLGTNTGRAHRATNLLLTQIATLPFVIAGISVWADTGGGLTWLLAGVVLSTVRGLTNAWVLLVEILR